jgi:hypothetical protein
MDKYAYCQGYNISFLRHLTYKTTYRPLIENMIYLTNCKSYLELGVRTPENLNSIRNLVDVCIGVDIENYGNIDGFYNMTTDDFFKQNQRKFDIIFIDADHRFEQVKIDFENSLSALNEFGVIIFHDTDPIHPDLLSDEFCSDSYKIVDYIYTNHPELNIITLPIHETGMSLVMRKNDRRINKQI